MSDLLSVDYTPEELVKIEALRSRLNVAKAIAHHRIRLGLTQDELGRRAGSKQSRVSELEGLDGNPRFDTLDRIATELGLMVVLLPRSLSPFPSVSPSVVPGDEK